MIDEVELVIASTDDSSSIGSSNSIASLYSSNQLVEGEVYSRKQLIEQFCITDKNINTGIFRPAGYNSIWLFITEKKSGNMTAYTDRLTDDILHWDGQTEGRKDKYIIEHQANNFELLVFYRESKTQHPEYGFRYEGQFTYVSHTGAKPAHFMLQRANSANSLTTTILQDLEANELEQADPEDLEVTARLEGRKITVLTNKYERDVKNRKAAIQYHGLNCQACGFNFEAFYGPRGKDFIHVHHHKPISSYGDRVIINPKTDLAVLCANCHAIIHRYPHNPLSLEELKQLIETKQKIYKL
jgi:predicted HNH restriction endonuclease